MTDTQLFNAHFPRSNQYSPAWLKATASGGANSLWLTEWLAERLDLQPGMRVLDLGCGCAASSVFLRREFQVQVWAVDLWISATENLRRIRHAAVEDGVFPIHVDARQLPFATGFFDAIVSIDSFPYYGTDHHYLNYLGRFVRPGGLIGMAGAGLAVEMDREAPEHLRAWWEPSMYCLHSADWWRQHWERSGFMDILAADSMADGWLRWLDWQRAIAPDNLVEIQAIAADQGRWLAYVRVIGRRRREAKLDEPVVSVTVPAEALPPLLRD